MTVTSLLIFLLLANYLSAYTIVKTMNGTLEQTFLLVNGWAKEIMDVDTITFLKHDPATLDTVPFSVIKSLKYGGRVSQIKQWNGTPDEVMRVELLKINTLQNRVLYDIKIVGEYINPAVVKFRGRLLLAAGLEWGFAGVNHKPATGHVEFAWINSTDYPFYSSDMYHGINMDINSLLVFPFTGQDPRMVVLDDHTIAICYTSMLHTIRMGVAELVIDEDMPGAVPHVRHLRISDGSSSNNFYRKTRKTTSDGAVNATIRNVFRSITPPPGSGPNEDQKNWAPFVYNGSMHYLQRVHPLHVVTLRHYDDDPLNELYSVSVSLQDFATNWRYGELRGGTNALLVPSGRRPWAEGASDVYVALFHSNTMIPGNILRTYFMGALAFSSHPPFRVLAMTEYPIVDNSLYDGAWDPIKNRHIDYVPFPSTIFLDGEVVHLSFGWQDNLGCTAKMRLSELLDIMVPV